MLVPMQESQLPPICGSLRERWRSAMLTFLYVELEAAAIFTGLAFRAERRSDTAGCICHARRAYENGSPFFWPNPAARSGPSDGRQGAGERQVEAPGVGGGIRRAPIEFWPVRSAFERPRRSGSEPKRQKLRVMVRPGACPDSPNGAAEPRVDEQDAQAHAARGASRLPLEGPEAAKHSRF